MLKITIDESNVCASKMLLEAKNYVVNIDGTDYMLVDADEDWRVRVRNWSPEQGPHGERFWLNVADSEILVY